jgi:hypothetical protein
MRDVHDKTDLCPLSVYRAINTRSQGMRPTKYNETLVKQAKDYLTQYQTFEAVPTIAGLAVYLDISRETVYAWAADPEKSEFSDICEKLMTKQEFTLLNGGIKGEFNPTITKLMLTKHSYSDKQESTVQGPGGSPLGITVTFHDPDNEDD